MTFVVDNPMSRARFVILRSELVAESVPPGATRMKSPAVVMVVGSKLRTGRFAVLERLSATLGRSPPTVRLVFLSWMSGDGPVLVRVPPPATLMKCPPAFSVPPVSLTSELLTESVPLTRMKSPVVVIVVGSKLRTGWLAVLDSVPRTFRRLATIAGVLSVAYLLKIGRAHV